MVNIVSATSRFISSTSSSHTHTHTQHKHIFICAGVESCVCSWLLTRDLSGKLKFNHERSLFIEFRDCVLSLFSKNTLSGDEGAVQWLCVFENHIIYLQQTFHLFIVNIYICILKTYHILQFTAKSLYVRQQKQQVIHAIYRVPGATQIFSFTQIHNAIRVVSKGINDIHCSLSADDTHLFVEIRRCRST